MNVRRFVDLVVQEDMRHWPFKVVCVDGDKNLFTPEEISSMVLLKMKQIAEAFLGEIKNAVVTIP
jgi:heat shock 70kDa protein 1/2/6/8